MGYLTVLTSTYCLEGSTNEEHVYESQRLVDIMNITADEARLCVTPKEEDTKMEVVLVVASNWRENDVAKAVIRKKWFSKGDLTVIDVEHYTKDGKVNIVGYC